MRLFLQFPFYSQRTKENHPNQVQEKVQIHKSKRRLLVSFSLNLCKVTKRKKSVKQGNNIVLFYVFSSSKQTWFNKHSEQFNHSLTQKHILTRTTGHGKLFGRSGQWMKAKMMTDLIIKAELELDMLLIAMTRVIFVGR